MPTVAICRDCKKEIDKVSITHCPACGSIYLIPMHHPLADATPVKAQRKRTTLEERIIAGFLTGFLTFITIELVTLMFVFVSIRGLKYAKDYHLVTNIHHIGFSLAAILSIFFGLISFINPNNSIPLISLIWGTNQSFTKWAEDRFYLSEIMLLLMLVVALFSLLIWRYYSK